MAQTPAPSKIANLGNALEQRKISPEVFRVLRSSVWPGAKDESILMAIDMCQARELNPLKKPVHIVPIYDSRQKKMIDSIWFSINELSITAHRTGQFGGASEAEYGEDIIGKVGNAEMTHPKWCKITVTRMLEGKPCEFTAKVHWKETYAQKKRDDRTPNAMWIKRPYDQLSKCTLAAALRMAFPEEVGNTHIMEEASDQISPDGSIPAEYSVSGGDDRPKQPEPTTKAVKKERPKPAGRREEPKEAKTQEKAPDVSEASQSPEPETQEPEKEGDQEAAPEAAPAIYNVLDAKMRVIARWEPGVDEVEALLTPLRTEISETETETELDFLGDNNESVLERLNADHPDDWKDLMQSMASKRENLKGELAV